MQILKVIYHFMLHKGNESGTLRANSISLHYIFEPFKYCVNFYLYISNFLSSGNIQCHKTKEFKERPLKPLDEDRKATRKSSTNIQHFCLLSFVPKYSIHLNNSEHELVFVLNHLSEKDRQHITLHRIRMSLEIDMKQAQVHTQSHTEEHKVRYSMASLQR